MADTPPSAVPADLKSPGLAMRAQTSYALSIVLFPVSPSFPCTHKVSVEFGFVFVCLCLFCVFFVLVTTLRCGITKQY